MNHLTLSANGQRIHAVEAGEGPLVLLVHGFPESWYSWRHQLKALSEAGYRAVAYDQRGYGRSSKPVGKQHYKVTDLVDDAAGVVKALGEQTATIVGHDWGAPVAWTAAWIKPEIFTSVVGMSVPFGGRAVIPLAGASPFGEMRPSDAHKFYAGRDDALFYQEYFSTPGLMDVEFESDVRHWITAALYSFSGSPPMPPDAPQINPADLTPEMVVEITRASPVIIPNGAKMSDALVEPDALPDWITQEEVDFYVEEFERSGIQGGLNYYAALDLSWEALEPYAGNPLEVPALFLGGTRDVATMWGLESIQKAAEVTPQIRGIEVFDGCGHWIQQEEAARTNEELLKFLGGL